jgi:ribonuclease P protein component
VSKYPLRLVYHCGALSDDQKNKMEFQFQKKFQKAVDRNYFKRILHETYRLNNILVDNLTNLMPLCYFIKLKRLSYDEINTKTIQLFEKFVAQNKKEQTDIPNTQSIE